MADWGSVTPCLLKRNKQFGLPDYIGKQTEIEGACQAQFRSNYKRRVANRYRRYSGDWGADEYQPKSSVFAHSNVLLQNCQDKAVPTVSADKYIRKCENPTSCYKHTTNLYATGSQK